MPHLDGNITVAEFVSRRPWPARVTVDDVIRIANQIDAPLKEGRIANCGVWNGNLSRLSYAVENDARRRRRAAGIPMTREGDERAQRLPSASMMEACAPGADELDVTRDALALVEGGPLVTTFSRERIAQAQAAVTAWERLVARRHAAGPDPHLTDGELDAILWAIRNVDFVRLHEAQAVQRFGDGCGYGALSSAANEVERALGVRLEGRR